MNFIQESLKSTIFLMVIVSEIIFATTVITKIKSHYPILKCVTLEMIPLNKLWKHTSVASDRSLTNHSSNLLLVTETPPGTPNGFGVTLDCMFKEINHGVVYTDAVFKKSGDTLGYLLAQVPYHPSGRFLPSFLIGKIRNGEVNILHHG